MSVHASVVIQPPPPGPIPIPYTNLPTFDTNTDGVLVDIQYANLKIGDVKGESQDKTLTSAFLFSCIDQSCGADVTGDYFSIDFGYVGLPGDDGNLKLEDGSFLKLEMSDVLFSKWLDKSSPSIMASISDFNGYLSFYDSNWNLQFKNYLGIEVIATDYITGAALKIDDDGRLIFDPAIPGGSARVNLLSAPVPEPSTLSLLGIA